MQQQLPELQRLSRIWANQGEVSSRRAGRCQLATNWAGTWWQWWAMTRDILTSPHNTRLSSALLRGSRLCREIMTHKFIIYFTDLELSDVYMSSWEWSSSQRSLGPEPNHFEFMKQCYENQDLRVIYGDGAEFQTHIFPISQLTLWEVEWATVSSRQLGNGCTLLNSIDWRFS